MTVLTPSASSVSDEKVTPLTHTETTAASPRNSRLADFQNIAADHARRVTERLSRLPIDDDVMKELNAWEDKGDIYSQLTNASLDHFKRIHMGYKPGFKKVETTGLSTKVPLGHILNVIDRRIGTQLEEQLLALRGKTAEWKKYGTSASADFDTKLWRDPWPWTSDVTPLLVQTMKAVKKVNMDGAKNDTKATSDEDDKSSIGDGSIQQGESEQTGYAVSVVSLV